MLRNATLAKETVQERHAESSKRHVAVFLQAIGSRTRSMQPLKSRLDSALEFAGQGSMRVSRSELLLSALPAIASSSSSSQPEASERAESGAGSSRSVAVSPSPSLGLSLSIPMLQSVSEVDISSAGTTTSPFLQQYAPVSSAHIFALCCWYSAEHDYGSKTHLSMVFAGKYICINQCGACLP